MKKVYPLLLLCCVTACTPEVGSEKWCEKMQQSPKSSWSFDDGVNYTKHCFVSEMTIGSEAWCESTSKKPKGDWTVEETRSYARYCVVRMPEAADDEG